MSEQNPGLPSGWAVAALSDVASINPRLDHSLSDDAHVAFVPMRAVDENGGGVVRPELRSVREVKKGYTMFRAGDVIMAKITPCMENGKTAVVPEYLGEVCFGSTEFHTIRPEGGIVAEWVSQFLLQDSTRRSAQREMTGAVGQMRVPGRFLSALRLPIAPPAEQRRIAEALDELLSNLETGVASVLRSREKLLSYRSSVLKAAVEGRLTATWRERNPAIETGSVLRDRIVEERRSRWERGELAKFESRGRKPPKNWQDRYSTPRSPESSEGEIPATWCTVTWEQIGFSQNGRPFPSTEYQTTGVKLLRPGNLAASGMVVWNDRNTRYLPDRYAEAESDLIIGGSELVMNLTAQSLKDDFLGRACLTAMGERCLLNQRLARLTPILVDPRFMLLVFKASPFRRFVAGLNSGSLIQHMFTSQLVDFTFGLPPLAEQEAIVEIVEDQLSIIDHLDFDLEVKLETAKSLRQSILHHAFTGKLVPQDPNDEPASELLERIAAEREARVTPRKAPTKRRATRAK